ncbi:MAG TPA: 23S rRNA (pseudouridine(1915)-N(3))-methyltransferase RlmH [Alphaproteobacteria bacterium]|nr:23S rRNA (pseudouridine(1915)-N(3))-methyltransferase RlmH [Alphaproteobacteria bacterium]
MSFHVEIIAVGRLKKTSPFYTLFDDYATRLQGSFNLIEVEGHTQADEIKKIKEKISPPCPLIILDERGKSFSSIDFAKKLENFQVTRPGKIQFVIGGADGLDNKIRQKADMVLCFGALTWPHMMARVMLVEQIYRAQQILANHPYHRE